MAVAIDLNQTHSAPAATTRAADRVARPQQSVAMMVTTTVLAAVVLVTAISGALIALTPAGSAEALGFALMIGFWIGVGVGIIASGVRLGLRWEAEAGH